MQIIQNGFNLWQLTFNLKNGLVYSFPFICISVALLSYSFDSIRYIFCSWNSSWMNLRIMPFIVLVLACRSGCLWKSNDNCFRRGLLKQRTCPVPSLFIMPTSHLISFNHIRWQSNMFTSWFTMLIFSCLYEAYI